LFPVSQNSISVNSLSENTLSENTVSGDSTDKVFEPRLYVYGDNFTPWSKIYVNGEKIGTQFIDANTLSVKISAMDLKNDGTDVLSVNQMGGNTILRSSNEIKISIVEETEE